MGDSPRRRFMDRLRSATSVLGPDCTFIGDVETAADFVLCGRLRGNGQIGGALSLAADAVWEGSIEAHDALISGRIDGALSVAGRLEIGATARIRGRISAGSIAIAHGAIVEGEILVLSGEPIHLFEDRRQS